MTTFEKDNQYIMHTYGRFDLCLVSGKGSTLKDENGKEYIDFGTGIAVNTFGVSDDAWNAAVTTQIAKLAHTSNLYYTEPCANLAELLCKKTGMSKVFFSNSGAEANECAIKAARKYGTDTDENKNEIITLVNSFHGRTVTTLSATGQEVFHKSFTPFTEGFVYTPANDCEALLEKIGPRTAAIMIETVQGEGGVMPLDDAFMACIEKITTENDILLIIDEVQTGNGRTGQLYSYMDTCLTPDIVSTAKGLAGGLPLGATMFNEKLRDILPPSTHGSTFGGNPVCCAGALSILERIDDALLKQVREKSAYMIEKLTAMHGVKSVSGKGFMLGIETEKTAGDIVKACMEKGLLVLTAKTKVRLLPALNISYAEIDKGLEILKGVIEA